MSRRSIVPPEAFRMPLRRFAQVSATYLLLYAASNHLTGLRAHVGRGVFEWERAIPFVEASIVPYLSIFALFVLSFFVGRDARALERHCLRLLAALAIAVVCYLAFPLRFDFERPVPTGVAGLVFNALWALDQPFNRAPSLHIALVVLLSARFWPMARGVWRPALAVWMAAIGVSVLTTYQHHVIDVAAGLAPGAGCLVLPARWLRWPSALTGSNAGSSAGWTQAGP